MTRKPASKKPAKKARKVAKRAEKKFARKPGRPTKYTAKVVEEICALLSDGVPLAEICRLESMPDPATVWRWQEARPDVSQAIARARELGEERIASDCLRIADTPQLGVIEKLEPDKETGALVVVERRNEDMLGHRKLQVDTRLKLLAKWNPKKWGDRQTLNHQGSIGLEALVAGAGEEP